MCVSIIVKQYTSTVKPPKVQPTISRNSNLKGSKLFPKFFKYFYMYFLLDNEEFISTYDFLSQTNFSEKNGLSRTLLS